MNSELTADGSNVLLWLCADDGKVEFFSPSWLAFTGRGADESLGDAWYANVHPDARVPLEAAMDAAVHKQQPFRQRLRLRRHDGEYCWFVCEGIVRLNADGAFGGLIGVFTDTTREEVAQVEAELEGRHFADLLGNTDLVAFGLDESGGLLFFNEALAQLLGENTLDLHSTTVANHFLDSQHRPLSECIHAPAEPPLRLETEFISCREGRRPFVWHLIPMRNYAGERGGIILIGDDLTDRRLAEEQLRLTAKVFETTDLAMIITDRQGTILSANSAFSTLTGYSAEEAVGANPRILQSGRHDREFYRVMWQTLLKEDRWQGEIWDKRKDGTVYPKYLSIRALRNDQGQITHYSGIFFDISERKAVEEKLSRLAHFDALTELPNRRLFEDRIDLACRRSAAGNERFAVLFIDLDHFKAINDTLGHQAGDELLKEAARRLRAVTRSQDTAGRVGGDEFAVLLADIKGPENAALVARKMLDSFDLPITLGDHPVTVTLSIGIAMCPEDGLSPEILMRHADDAMYRVKSTGRRGYRFHRDLKGG